jgi:hypothetical protein
LGKRLEGGAGVAGDRRGTRQSFERRRIVEIMADQAEKLSAAAK